MIYKCYLILGQNTVDTTNSKCFVCTDMVTNLSDLKMTYTRSNLGGVVRKCSYKIRFTGKAYYSIIEEYRNNYLNSKGAISFMTINDTWGYDKLWECPLDFSTMEYDDNTLSISCFDNSAAAIIKARKSTKYEIPVSSIKDNHCMKLEGALVKNSAVFKVAEASVENETYMKRELTSDEKNNANRIYPAININGEPDIVVNNSISIQDQKEYINTLDSIGSTSSDVYLLKALKDCIVNIDFSSLKVWASDMSYGIYFYLHVKHSNGQGKFISSKGIVSDGKAICTIKAKLSLLAGDKVSFWITDTSTLNFKSSVFYFSNNAINLTWNDRSDAVSIDVIKPINLLNRLLSNMSDDITMTGVINTTVRNENNERLINTLIIAAESIRDMYDAKIYSTFGSFCDFMEYEYGYIYEIEETGNNAVITFRHYSEVYGDSVVKKIDNVSDVNCNVSNDRIYSKLIIGYEKQDYDNDNNGNDEFNFSNEYTTGNTLNDNEKSMICPYRADCYGITELLSKRNSETGSTDSDSDVFIVKVLSELTDDEYISDRSIVVHGSYSDTVFNALLAPVYMIEANKSMIGCYAEKLIFASCTGNSSIVIGDESVNSDIDISDRIITATDIELDTNDSDIPSDWEGIIQFEWDGYIFNAYLNSVDINYNGITKYKLIEKSRYDA